MIERLLERHRAVLAAERPGESGAGGCERGEAELLKESCAADVPRIGDDEAAGFVKSVELTDACGNHWHKYTGAERDGCIGTCRIIYRIASSTSSSCSIRPDLLLRDSIIRAYSLEVQRR